MIISCVQDMVAFSCCIFDGGKKEKEDMDAARERGWKGKFTKPGRVIRPGAIRINGKCPLTPLEVHLLLSCTFSCSNTNLDYNSFIFHCEFCCYPAMTSLCIKIANKAIL